MVSWFLFINSVMVIFLLPLSWLRFFWWRFNVWGELAAFVLGLPLSILVWFVLGYEKKPFWIGTGFLFLLSFAVLITVPLLTPAESRETLLRFYQKCRPPGLWKGIREAAGPAPEGEPSAGHLIVDSAVGIAACLGLVLATNALFAGSWATAAAGGTVFLVLGSLLLRRVLIKSS
ncbi:MAG: hypothetical protein ABSG19_08230 [Candidatus Aminicenantales bacterium]